MVTRTGRNAAVMGASGLSVAVLFLFPTSTHSAPVPRRAGAAAVGVVSTPVATGASPVSAAVVVNGAAVDTQFGPVQVQITVKGGRIVAATAINYPQSGGRDQEINSYAIPVLQRETVAAQSVKIDTVSGATYTSQGYLASLQSALDAAHL